MEDQNDENKNEIKEESNYENDIINISKYLAEEPDNNIELKDDNLYYYFYKKDIYNQSCKKLLDNKNYIKLMNIINSYLKQKKYDYILLYFKKIDIDIIKVIFNGYITSIVPNPDEKNFLLEKIKNIIPLFFSKNIFYIIYNKLSKIFRKFFLFVDKEIIFDKFCKIIDLWKLLYDVNAKKIVNANYFTLIGKKVLVLMNIKNTNKYQFNEVRIFIEFEGEISKLNNDKDIINVCYLEEGSYGIKFEDIKKEEKIKNILVKINEESINYILNKNYDFDENENEKFIQIKQLESPSNFAQIDILKNYIGKIRRILIKTEFKKSKIKNYIYEYEIIPKNNIQGFEINSFEEKEGIIKLSFELASKINLISNKIYKDILYEDIRYYGGLECFIPILKIIKYFISRYKEDENKINKLNEIIIDIVRHIIKFICYSKNNFKNFKKILVPLLSALAGINEVNPNNHKIKLYSDHVFSLLYIIIISSSFPFAIKKTYQKITGIYHISKLNLNFDKLIIDVNEINITSYQWYATILVIVIEFILLSFNDINKIPKNIINQLLLLQKKVDELDNKDLEQIKIKISSYIKSSIESLTYIIKSEKEENNFFDNCAKIEDISEYFKSNFINNKENIILPLLMIKIYLNLINLESFWYKLDKEKQKEKEKGEQKNIFEPVFKNFFNTFEKLSPEIPNKIKDLIINFFENYITNKEYLMKIFPFLKTENFRLEAELLLSELTDFHSEYHNVMKNNFVFNKFWSDKKLFFDEKKKEKYLKYKSINYYTKNYQKPFIFPDLDYKYTYPNFNKFKIPPDFYIEEENPDEYNFYLDCPELDDFNINYEKELLENMKNNSKINSFEVCMVKRTHHIKGKMFVCNDGYSLIKKIIFYSYPQNIAKDIPCCNSSYKSFQDKNKDKKNLCFGAIFDCPEKYMNIKITIHVKDIRMILKKIYFYRKSAVEIFTKNKSYFFNFADKTSKQSEKNCSDFTNMFGFFISEFFPIAINKEIIGHARQFEALLESYKNKETKYDISVEGNKFISALFGHWTTNIKDIEFSTLDLLIYLNLLSNRSYNDLFQYPIFPLLFFYDKGKDNLFSMVDRKLNTHIGLQDVTEKSKLRKNLIKETYMNSIKEYEELEDNEMETPSYFNTHFSNNFYVSNFLIRIFPYSFLAIEQQGTGFDMASRLFFSIEETFYNISSLKSDLRELIPEFYYLPEIFWNINKFNFGQRDKGILVDDVEMPQDMTKIDKDKDKNSKRISIDLNDEYESSDYFRSFKFIEKMRNLLESKQIDIIAWINIIFGPRQKYKDEKKEDLYFRYESYIDYSNIKKNELKFYRHDKTSMTSVEFGITPIQTVFEGDTGKSKNRTIYYNLNVKENKDYFKKLCKVFTDKIKPKLNQVKEENSNINKDELNKNKNIIKYTNGIYKINKIKERKKIEGNFPSINNIFLEPELHIKCIYQNKKIKIIGYKSGKIEVFKLDEKGNDELISEFFDHKDEINHVNYNQRLNLICTTSKDGFLNVYSLPNKLITTIKNPNNNNFGLIFLSSNPFPSIIVQEQDSFNIFSYTINGFKIKKANILDLFEIKDEDSIEMYLCSHFNENGGTFKDRLIFIEYNTKEKDGIYKCHLLRVPFFEEEDKTVDIKSK